MRQSKLRSSSHARVRLLAVAAGIFSIATASAHHSFAIFDHTQTYKLSGTVESFQWTNPHGYIALEVDEGPEGLTKFTLELTSINMLRRTGWRSTDVQPGDHVTAITAPLISGEPGGLLLEIRIPDGRTLRPPVPAVDTFTVTPE